MSHIADITLTASETGKLRDLLINLEEVAWDEAKRGDCTENRNACLYRLSSDAIAMEQELMHRLLTAGVVDDEEAVR